MDSSGTAMSSTVRNLAAAAAAGAVGGAVGTYGMVSYLLNSINPSCEEVST